MTKKRKPKVSTSRKLEKIGLFGGTFNPIHYGHLGSAETVKTALKLKKIIFMPAAQNPFRPQTEGPAQQERLDMARAALTTLGGEASGFEVSDIEIHRGGVSYTIDTLKVLKGDIYLIVGADQLADFSKWKSYDQILKKANLVVTTRPGYPLPTAKDELPEWLKNKTKTFSKNKGKLASGKKLIFILLNDQDISSTEIRQKARRGEDVTKLTPGAVAQIIKDKKLYDRVGQKIADYSELAKFCARILNEKGGLKINAYDVRHLEQPTEYAMVSSGTSTRHTKALAEHIMREVKNEYGVYPQGTEGLQEARWVVLDYGSLMIHLFYDFVRNEYRVEELWASGQPLSI